MCSLWHTEPLIDEETLMRKDLVAEMAGKYMKRRHVLGWYAGWLILPGVMLGQITSGKPVIQAVPVEKSAPAQTAAPGAVPAAELPPPPGAEAPAAATQDTPPMGAVPGATPPGAATAGSTPSKGPLAPAPADVSATYKIGPSDGLQVTVWKEPSLSGGLTVRPDGMISLPLLGDVKASGMTPMQLGVDLKSRLKKYINDPLVTVTVVNVNSQRVYLLGEVQHIGPLPLVDGMTPLQAISAGGGLTPYANARHIYILRGEQGRQQKLPYNYKKALKDGNQQGVTLISGDTIVVP